MPVTKYTKWTGSLLDGLSMEELLEQISEFLLQSGFQGGFRQWHDAHDFEALRQAIIEKLSELGRIPKSLLKQWLENRDAEESRKLEDLISQVIARLVDEGWLRATLSAEAEISINENQGTEDAPIGSARFEL